MGSACCYSSKSAAKSITDGLSIGHKFTQKVRYQSATGVFCEMLAFNRVFNFTDIFNPDELIDIHEIDTCDRMSFTTDMLIPEQLERAITRFFKKHRSYRAVRINESMTNYIRQELIRSLVAHIIGDAQKHSKYLGKIYQDSADLSPDRWIEFSNVIANYGGEKLDLNTTNIKIARKLEIRLITLVLLGVATIDVNLHMRSIYYELSQSHL